MFFTLRRRGALRRAIGVGRGRREVALERVAAPDHGMAHDRVWCNLAKRRRTLTEGDAGRITGVGYRKPDPAEVRAVGLQRQGLSARGRQRERENKGSRNPHTARVQT